jgi:hypothetical protein
MSQAEAITEELIYRFLNKSWHTSVRKSQANKLALGDLGFTELEVKWLLTSIEWKYQISINVESMPLQTSVETFIQKIVTAPKAA